MHFSRQDTNSWASGSSIFTGVDDRLNKPGKLTPEELAMFRSHPAKGKRILEPIPFMRDIVPGCYCHHEAWDGSGYPQGLMGDHIPLIARFRIPDETV